MNTSRARARANFFLLLLIRRLLQVYKFRAGHCCSISLSRAVASLSREAYGQQPTCDGVAPGV